MANTTRTGWLFPDMSARADLTQVKAWGDNLGNDIGAPNCTSTSRPSSGNYAGRLAWETDTKALIRYDGTAWVYMNATDVLQGTVQPALVGAASTVTSRRIRQEFSRTITTSSSGTAVVTWPAPFPNGIGSVHTSPAASGSNLTVIFSATASNLTAGVFTAYYAATSDPYTGSLPCSFTLTGW